MKVFILVLVSCGLFGQARIPGPGGSSASSGGGFTVLANSKCTNASAGCTSPAINASGATLLIAWATTFGPNTTSHISDSSSNTWVGPNAVGTNTGNCGGCIGALYFVANPTTSSSQTVTFSSSGVSSLFVVAFSGGPTLTYSGVWSSSTTYSQYQIVNNTGDSGLYMSIVNSNNNNLPSSSPSQWRNMFSTNNITTGASLQAASAIVPLANHSLILSLMETNNTSTLGTIDSSLTIIDNTLTNFPAAVAWLDQSSAASINPTWTISGNTTTAGVVTIFFY